MPASAPTPPAAECRVQQLVRVRELCANGQARRIRLAARLTLAEVGEQIGTSAANVFRWETDTHRPTGDLAIAYLATLDRIAARP